jgi:GNAT acetyltransferase-like protein
MKADLQFRSSSEGEATWGQLLAATPRSTLYHRSSWIELLSRAYGLSFWLATIHENQKVRAGCLFARSRNPFKRRFVSLPFSDTCPPLATDSSAANELLDALIAENAPAAAYEIRGIEGAAPWTTAECFANWRLDLDRSIANIAGSLASNFRRNLQRSLQQGIKVEQGSGIDYVERFYALQLKTRRVFGLPPQPWRFFRLTQQIFGPDGSLAVWIASQDGEDVSSAVFLRDRDVSYYKWGARLPGHQSSANHLLFWNAIEELVSQRARAIDLGRADIRNQGLTRFKKELGAIAEPLPYSFYPRVPARVSPEVLTGTDWFVAKVWARMPIVATRVLGGAIYRFLA